MIYLRFDEKKKLISIPNEQKPFSSCSKSGNPIKTGTTHKKPGNLKIFTTYIYIYIYLEPF